jgi:hypothetical protein
VTAVAKQINAALMKSADTTPQGLPAHHAAVAVAAHGDSRSQIVQQVPQGIRPEKEEKGSWYQWATSEMLLGDNLGSLFFRVLRYYT